MAAEYLKSLVRAAKNLRNPTEPNIAGLTRDQTIPRFHTGEVTTVDVGRKVLGLKFNDPSGAEIETGVPWMQPLTTDNPPQVGQTVRYVMIGNQPFVMGGQVTPDDTVTFD